MKLPRIKKLQTIKDVSIWQVDGNYIRNKIDVNFNNSGHHFTFHFIPVNEIWVDKDFSQRGDEKLLATQSFIERSLMKKGVSYNKALSDSVKIARQERKKSNDIPKNKTYDHVYVRKINKYCANNIQVWLVNGKLVRDNFYIHFTEGGHHYVYHFIPKNEVWLDDSLNPKEYDYVLFHELLERNLMKFNQMPYGKAHDVAIGYEGIIRKNNVSPVNLIFNELSRKK
jgi:hypothetical protein